MKIFYWTNTISRILFFFDPVSEPINTPTKNHIFHIIFFLDSTLLPAKNGSFWCKFINRHMETFKKSGNHNPTLVDLDHFPSLVTLHVKIQMVFFCLYLNAHIKINLRVQEWSTTMKWNETLEIVMMRWNGKIFPLVIVHWTRQALFPAFLVARCQINEKKRNCIMSL